MKKDEVLILIPPSEGKAEGGEGKKLKKKDLSPGVKEMAKKLMDFEGDWQKLLGVKGDYLQEAIEANKNLFKNPTMPAIERYTGTVYKYLEYETMDKKSKKFCEDHLRILSALFGLLKPSDSIPMYKLKINKLRAYKHWKPHLTEEVKGKFIIDLLPRAHSKAIEYEEGIEVDFKKMKKGKLRSAGHGGKKIKGKFVRWLCENQITDPDGFKEFEEGGYKWTGEYFLKD